LAPGRPRIDGIFYLQIASPQGLPDESELALGESHFAWRTISRETDAELIQMMRDLVDETPAGNVILIARVMRYEHLDDEGGESAISEAEAYRDRPDREYGDRLREEANRRLGRTE
jgi:hypothetical protein